jgi:hypothetical protein
MAEQIKSSKRMQRLIDRMPEVRTIDADTVADSQGSVRFKDARAPEVQHITPDGLKPASAGGLFYSDMYENLWTESGMNNVYRTGEKGYYGRDLGGLEDKYGRDFMEKAVYEGLANPQGHAQREIYDLGIFQRAFNNDVSGEETDDIWSQARDKMNEYQADTSIGIRKTALNEVELREYKDFYGSTFSPYFDNQVDFRHPGRTINNEATADFSGGWSYGFAGIKESLNNAISFGGDVIGSQMLYDNGQVRADESRYKMSQLPRINNDFTQVENFGDMVDWLQTSAGVMMPYAIGMIGSYMAGTVALASTPITGPVGAAVGTALIWQAPMMWVYAGEIYGGMEGEMDQRNAGIATVGGIAMASLERLGLKGLISTGTVLKRDGLEKVAQAYAKKEGVDMDVARLKIQDVFGNLTVAALKDLDTIATLQMSKGILAKQTAKGFIGGATIEGLTEIAQESISYQGSRLGTDADIRKPFDMVEYKRIMANAAAGGIFLGGAMRTTSTLTSEIGGFQKLKRQGSKQAKIDDGWQGGTVEENMDELVNDTSTVTPPVKPTGPQSSPEYGSPEYYNQGAGTNASKESLADEMKAERIKGDKEDKSTLRGGLKTVYQNLKEFPKRFTQSGPKFWENKVLKNPNISEKAKKAFQVLQTITGGGKLSSMEGIDLFEMKRMMQSGLMAEGKTIQDDLYLLMGVGIELNGRLHTGRTKAEANTFFLDYLDERITKSQDKVSAKFKPFVEKLEELRLAIGGQESNGDGVTDRLYGAVDGLIARTGPNKKPYWFQKSRRLKKDTVLSNKSEFIQTLEDNGWTAVQAQDFYDMIENGPPGYDLSSMHELGFMNFPSRSLKTSKGILEQVFGDDSKFLENDPFQRLYENIQEQTNYAVDRRYLGKDGHNINTLLKIIKDDMGSDWDSRIATHFMDYIAASRGDYRRLKSKKLERMIGHITFFNTFGHLDLSALASLPEAAIVLLSATKDSRIMPQIAKGVEEFSAKLRNDASKNWSYINPKSGVTREKYLRNLVDFYRYGYDTGAHGAIGQVGIDEGVYKASKVKEAIMKAFFSVNLLKIYTDGTRVARLSLANDAIFGDFEIIAMFPEGSVERSSGLYVDAFERLRELNIDPHKAADTYTTMVQLSKAKLGEGATSEELYETMIKYNPAFMKQMDIARVSWVDNAIAHPTAMNRPIWYSNPAYRIFTQYNGFMSVFTAQILPKIWRRIKRADPSAKYNAVAIATSMIALGFLSQMLKDEWRYDGAPGWITTKGYVQRGVASSGLLGTPERFLTMISPIYDMSKKWSESRMDNILRRTGHAVTDALGPTYAHGEQIGRIMFNAFEGDDQRRNFYLSKEIPFLGKLAAFKEYNLGENDTGMTFNDALRKSTPSISYPL